MIPTSLLKTTCIYSVCSNPHKSAIEFTGVSVSASNSFARSIWTRRICCCGDRLRYLRIRRSRELREIGTFRSTSETVIPLHAFSRMNFNAIATSVSSIATTSVECRVQTPNGSTCCSRVATAFPDISWSSVSAARNPILSALGSHSKVVERKVDREENHYRRQLLPLPRGPLCLPVGTHQEAIVLGRHCMPLYRLALEVVPAICLGAVFLCPMVCHRR